MSLRQSPLGIFVNPAHIAERSLHASISSLVKELQPAAGELWIDVGCGSRPYQGLFHVGKFVGLDVLESGRSAALKRPDIFYDGRDFPFRDGSADGILCTQVLEHATSAEHLLSEIARCLKPGGMLILTAPFLWEEHEIPFDFLRFTRFGLQQMLEQQGLQITRMKSTTGSLETLAQALSITIFNHFRLPLPGFGRLLTLFICAPIQIAGIIAQRVLSKCDGLYLDNAVLARKPTKPGTA
jgi:SAM-dependent methyltransferase